MKGLGALSIALLLASPIVSNPGGLRAQAAVQSDSLTAKQIQEAAETELSDKLVKLKSFVLIAAGAKIGVPNTT